jgi:quercetin dioxygenase-like cupin family protein
MSLDAFLSTPDDAETLSVFSNSFSIPVPADRTGGAISAVQGTFEPGGFAPLPHVHRDEDELFYVVDGAFDFRMGSEVRRGSAGSFVFVPRGTFHGFTAAGEGPSRLVFFHLPGLDGFFRELALLTEPRSSELRKLMSRWGMDVPG